MAVPSASADRKRRPILLSLTLFLFLSAILVLLFLFLGPSSTQYLPFLPSPSIPSLSAPHHQQQHSPTPIPTPGSSPNPQPAEIEPKAATSAPDATTAVPEGSGTSDPSSRPVHNTSDVADDDEDDGAVSQVRWETCKVRRGVSSPADYIPCLDNIRAIKALRSRRHMEHRERHCPAPPPRCLVRTPTGYRLPVPWPQSRDMVRTLRACLCRFGTTTFLTQNWWSIRRTRNGLQSLVIILFSPEVELSSKMVLEDTFSL